MNFGNRLDAWIDQQKSKWTSCLVPLSSPMVAESSHHFLIVLSNWEIKYGVYCAERWQGVSTTKVPLLGLMRTSFVAINAAAYSSASNNMRRLSRLAVSLHAKPVWLSNRECRIWHKVCEDITAVRDVLGRHGRHDAAIKWVMITWRVRSDEWRKLPCRVGEWSAPFGLNSGQTWPDLFWREVRWCVVWALLKKVRPTLLVEWVPRWIQKWPSSTVMRFLEFFK